MWRGAGLFSGMSLRGRGDSSLTSSWPRSSWMNLSMSLRMTFSSISDLFELSDLEESSDFDLLSFFEEESPLEERWKRRMTEPTTSWRNR